MRIVISGCLLATLFLSACNSTRKTSNTAGAVTKADALQELLNSTPLQSAHVGISVFDPTSGEHLYNHQANKYFVPASNTKIPTCYAAMKFLGDSTLTFRFAENDTAIFIRPAGDPSFMHRDYSKQPAIDWLKTIKKPVYFIDDHWKTNAWGSGWSWSDYDATYMAERSPLPVYGNTVVWEKVLIMDPDSEEMQSAVSSDPSADWQVLFSLDDPNGKFRIERAMTENLFTIHEGAESNPKVELPFVTNGLQTAIPILADSLQRELGYRDRYPGKNTEWKNIQSQPLDSVLKPMMNRSDNFMAEQLLLMTSNQLTGQLRERLAIDSLLKTVLADLPDAPRWVDGSGLSRYNLFTPRDFVSILLKMQTEFGLPRIQGIFPAGGAGTLSNYYKADTPYLYAKTGTLSGVVALSGFLKTDSGRWLIFSVLVNNHQASASDVRRAVEQFLLSVKTSY
jgi:D-alanyl-D-alanine carboxypeptidase/D-alanyl-D-alanine-endopeptidase (penicillin-binding protein 4)